MTSERRTYTADEKAAALTLAADVGVMQASRTLSIPPATINRWQAIERRPPGNPPGRPSKLLDGHTKETLLANLALGVPIVTCCNLAGVEEQTYYRWMKQGAVPPPDDPDADDPDAIYRAFREEALHALAESERAMVAVLASAAQGINGYTPDWRAAEALLKRRFADRWNVGYSKTEHSGQVDSRVETVTVETREEREQAAQALRDDLAARRQAREQQTG